MVESAFQRLASCIANQPTYEEYKSWHPQDLSDLAYEIAGDLFGRRKASSFISMIAPVLANTGSPLEQVMLMALMWVGTNQFDALYVKLPRERTHEMSPPEDVHWVRLPELIWCCQDLQPRNIWAEPSLNRLMVEPQHQLGQYRADLLVTAGVETYVFELGQPFDYETITASTVVECDGHDFHERTREQAEHDRRRDRSMQQNGMTVLRYTGSEIWRDPALCAADVVDFLVQSVHRLTAERLRECNLSSSSTKTWLLGVKPSV